MWGNPRLVQWDYGKEINITLEDALMSLESLRFMLGGAIKRPLGTDTVVVHHTEEVVTGDNAAKVYVPAPKDHITGIQMLPAASAAHPIKLINLTKGYRTQITEGTMAALNSVLFKNPKAGIASAGESPVAGDKIRIFWESVLKRPVVTSHSSSLSIRLRYRAMLLLLYRLKVILLLSK